MQRDIPCEELVMAGRSSVDVAACALERLNLEIARANSIDFAAAAGSVGRAFDELVAAVGHPPKDLLETLADAALNAAVIFHAACLPGRVVVAGTLGATAARSSGDLPALRRALVIEAIGQTELGDSARAMACLNEALDLALQLRDHAAQCSVWNQLGLVLSDQGQAREAVSAFERVIELAESDAALLHCRVVALCNLGLIGLEVHEYSAAGLRAALTALALSPQPSTQLEHLNRSTLESIAARLLARLGETDSARQHAIAATAHAKAGGARASAVAEIAQGVVEVSCGQYEQGIGRLRAAVDVARHHVKGMHFSALRALIGAYEQAGQKEVARVYLEELLRLSREAKEQRLLEQHHRHLAALVKKSDGARDLVESELQRQRTRLSEGAISRDSVRSMMLLLEEHANAAELHDDSTSKHIYRVGRMSALIAREIGLDENTQFMLDLSARLHDTGKLFVPDAILLKPGKLTDEERAVMQTHTTAGADYLKKTGLPTIEIAVEIALCHHERYDGKGYPAGLKGSGIPISARIAALADVFDALTHERPYKRAWTIPEALAEMRSLRGTHFDPELTDVFLSLIPRLQREVDDLDSYLAAEAENSRFVQTRRALAARLKGEDPAVTTFELRR
jgi:putative two-component system response regulator